MKVLYMLKKSGMEDGLMDRGKKKEFNDISYFLQCWEGLIVGGGVSEKLG